MSSWPAALCQVKQEQAKLPNVALGHDKVNTAVQEASGSLWGLQADCTPAEQLSHLGSCTTYVQLICLRAAASRDVQLLCGMPEPFIQKAAPCGTGVHLDTASLSCLAMLGKRIRSDLVNGKVMGAHEPKLHRRVVVGLTCKSGRG